MVEVIGRNEKSSSAMQTIKLLNIQLLQYMGANEVIHGKDKKKKRNACLLLATYIILAVMLAFYMAGGALGLCILGLADIVPAYTLSITSIVILFFTSFKAGSMLFQVNSYEMLISLPIKPISIVVSRFMNMYIGNLVLTIITMFPAGIIYGIYVKAAASFYMMFTISMFMVPFVPLTIASIIGVIITAIGARMKHKNAANILITLFFLMGILMVSFYPALRGSVITKEQIADFSTLIITQLNNIYPLTKLYAEAIVNGNITAFAGFLGISIGVFIVFAGIVQHKYAWICESLITHRTSNHYVMRRQYQKTPLKAMYVKEIRRYLSSTIYVVNTAVGYIMMIIAALALLIMGVDKLESMIEMEGIIQELLGKIMPFVLAALGMMGTTTLSSISLEGKQWWIPKSLPVSTKTIIDSKIMVNLTLAVPSIVLAASLSMMALGNQGIKLVWLFVIPLMYCLFASVLGIAINLKFPQFGWDDEVRVVKQGAALMIGILLEFVSVTIGIGIIIIFSSLSYSLLNVIITISLVIITIAIYKKSVKYELRKLE